MLKIRINGSAILVNSSIHGRVENLVFVLKQILHDRTESTNFPDINWNKFSSNNHQCNLFCKFIYDMNLIQFFGSPTQSLYLQNHCQ